MYLPSTYIYIYMFICISNCFVYIMYIYVCIHYYYIACHIYLYIYIYMYICAGFMYYARAFLYFVTTNNATIRQTKYTNKQNAIIRKPNTKAATKANTINKQTSNKHNNKKSIHTMLNKYTYCNDNSEQTSKQTSKHNIT